MRELIFGPCTFALCCLIMEWGYKQSLEFFVVGPPLDPVFQNHPGMTQACEGPLLHASLAPTDPVECTPHSKASKSMFVCLGS